MQPRPAPRACRVDVSAPGFAWLALPSRVAALGLADVVLAHAFPEVDGLPSDLDRPHPELDAASLRRAGIAMWLELRLDALDPRGPSAMAAGALFRQPDWDVVDPRSAELAATADFHASDLVAWWANHLRGWHQAGVAGLVVDHADHVPPAFVRALTHAVPGFSILPRLQVVEAAQAWRDSGIDGVVVDADTLDLRRDGAWTAVTALIEVAPLVLKTSRDPAVAAALGEGFIADLPPPDDAAAAERLVEAARIESGTGAPRPLAAGNPAFVRREGEHAVRIEIDRGTVTTTAETASRPILRERPDVAERATRASKHGRIGIEAVTPTVDVGRFAAKRTVCEPVAVECDIVCDGHDKLAAMVQFRPANETAWREAAMAPLGNDRWAASFTPDAIGRWQFRVLAWRDAFATFQDELTKKVAAGLDVTLELREGTTLVGDAAKASQSVKPLLNQLEGLSDAAARVKFLLAPEITAAVHRTEAHPFASVSHIFPLDCDRVQASFASWYELFPRSMSPEPGRHGTLLDVVGHLPRIAAMGFDILYFPPIHPIGEKNKKGRNNSLTPEPGEPGSPYAIGSEDGGHEALHPELGTLEDFEALRQATEAHGMELAIDFAIQCSPDHPWLAQHHDWFAWRPDGTIRYAENPPKKYEDIVNVDFYAHGAVPDLWVALCDVVKLWAQRGVKVFRVDNPHTKPFPFWEWLIDEVRSSHPDAIFLAEAFTRPKVMGRLGKVGFTQSYTYFTWRNTRAEMEEYLTQLNAGPLRDYFRPNFFVNTPDINPPFLQEGGRPAHLIRAALATLLSGSWGMYSGFELCEATPVPGREDYLDSEKYQLRHWDWDRPGNISREIARLNTVRRRNAALHTHLGVTFLPCDDPQVMVFEKATEDRSNVLVCAVSFDPTGPHTPNIELPLSSWKLPDGARLACEDVLHDTDFVFDGKWQRVALTPDAPYTVWRTKPAA